VEPGDFGSQNRSCEDFKERRRIICLATPKEKLRGRKRKFFELGRFTSIWDLIDSLKEYDPQLGEIAEVIAMEGREGADERYGKRKVTNAIKKVRELLDEVGLMLGEGGAFAIFARRARVSGEEEEGEIAGGERKGEGWLT